MYALSVRTYMMADEEEQRDTSVHPRPLSPNAINNQDYVGVHVRILAVASS